MIKPGQVLWLKTRFDNSGTISSVYHPNLVMVVNVDCDYIEVCFIDSIKKENKWRLMQDKTIIVPAEGETVIWKDSYAQLDKIVKLEYFDGLENAKKTEDVLSKESFKNIKQMYYEYRRNHYIDDNDNIYMTKEEIQLLNEDIF